MKTKTIVIAYCFSLSVVWGFLLLFTMVILGCASEPKEARTWKTKQLADAATKIKAEMNVTSGPKACTINYHHGLLEDIASPRSSIYGTKSTVEFINELGCSHVITFGPEADGKMTALGYKSDPAYMLKYNEARIFAATIRKAIAGQKLPQPIVGFGMSMGGHNILKIAVQDPTLFSKIVLLNPMILGPEQWTGEFALDFSKPLGELDAGLMPGNHYTKEEWAYENPITELTQALSLPPVFVTACKQDQFKLGPPTERWVRTAREYGFNVVFNYVSNCKHTEPVFDGVKEFLNVQ